MFLFRAITSGIPIGAQYYHIAFLAWIIVTLALVFLKRLKGGAGTCVLIVTYRSDPDVEEAVRRCLHIRPGKFRSKVVKGGTTELAMELYLKTDNLNITQPVQNIDGVQDVTLVEYRGNLARRWIPLFLLGLVLAAAALLRLRVPLAAEAIPASDKPVTNPMKGLAAWGENYRQDLYVAFAYVPVYWSELELRQGEYENPVFRRAHRALIAALGQRYADAPQAAFIELGSLGHWGKWHVDTGAGIAPFPTQAVTDGYVQDYLAVFFPRRLLLRRSYTIGRDRSLGPYNDSFGLPDSRAEWLSWIAEGYRSDQAEAPFSQWGPGAHELSLFLPGAGALSKGRYSLWLGIRAPLTGVPGVALQMETRHDGVLYRVASFFL